MRKRERAAGALFLLSTITFLAGSGMLEPILQRTDLLASADSDRARVLAGLLLEFINAIAVVGIAILLLPTLKKYYEAYALGYFASRIIESALLMMSIVGPLILLALSEQSISAGASGSGDSTLQALGNTAVDAHYLLFDMAMLALSIGSLLLCFILYRSRLVPRLLSTIGLIGYTALLTSSALSIAGLDAGEMLYIPGAIFEIAFPVWLMVKGLSKGND
jgi:hypothetical protein